jgi:hypothetical protein
MWYRYAITEIDPSGQINFPDMGKGKLDYNDLSFKIEYRGKKLIERYGRIDTYRIEVYAPGSKKNIGHLDFGYDELSNSIVIILIQVFDFEVSKDIYMSNIGRGISTKLYEKMLEFIKSNPKLSTAEYMVSNVHSLQTHKAQNRVFGKPESIGKHKEYETAFRNLSIANRSLEQLLDFDKKQPGRFQDNIVEIQQEIELLNKLLDRLRIDEDSALETLKPSEWSDMGSDLGGDAFDTVHRIPKESRENKIQEKDPNQLELFDVV